jgi:hypothetical protein
MSDAGAAPAGAVATATASVSRPIVRAVRANTRIRLSFVCDLGLSARRKQTPLVAPSVAPDCAALDNNPSHHRGFQREIGPRLKEWLDFLQAS